MTKITTNIDLAVERLKQGEVVAIPTETVYGLAADATNSQAVNKIFAIKKRPLNHPLIMHVCHDWDLSQWVSDIPEYARKMMSSFWPGPLTLVFNSKDNAVLSCVNGGQTTIAIRSPKHDLTQRLLKQFNRPLVAPSANPFGQISPTTALHVAQSFPDENFLILDGGRCDVGIESSIILATDPNGYAVLRPGIIDLNILQNNFPQQDALNISKPRVSGQLDSHYKPQKKLYYLDDWSQLAHYKASFSASIYSISITVESSDVSKRHCNLSDNVQTVAYQLYDVLRAADQSDSAIIVIELPPDQIKWRAIREKIMKAGEPINHIS